MHQTGRVHGRVGVVGQLTMGEALELVVERTEQRLQSGSVATAGCMDQLGYVNNAHIGFQNGMCEASLAHSARSLRIDCAPEKCELVRQSCVLPLRRCVLA